MYIVVGLAVIVIVVLLIKLVDPILVSNLQTPTAHLQVCGRSLESRD